MSLVNDRDVLLQSTVPRYLSGDNLLTPEGKATALQGYNAIQAEKPTLDTLADGYGVSRVAYDNAVGALVAYLSTLSGWNVIPGFDVVIVGTTFRAAFAAVYTAREQMLAQISTAAKTLADSAQATANAANAELAAIASDNVLSSGEKPSVVLDYNTILAEQAGIDAQADAFAQSRSDYDTAIVALKAYILGLSPAYNNYTLDTPISGPTLRTVFGNVYTAKQALLNAIAARGKAIADAANYSANNVTTGQIVPNAATDILSVTGGAGLPYNTGPWFNVLQLSYTAVVSGTILATLTGNAAHTFVSIGGGGGPYSFSGSGILIYNTQNGAQSSPMEIPGYRLASAAANSFLYSFTQAARFAVTAGVTYTFQVLAYEFTNQHSTVLSNMELRLEVIKR